MQRLFFIAFVISIRLPSYANAQDKAAELPAGIRLLHTIKAPKGTPGRAVVFADRGRQIVTTTDAGIHSWDLTTGERRHTWSGSFKAITVSENGDTLAAMDEKNEVHFFDVSTRKKQWQFRFTGANPKDAFWPNDTAVLSFSPDGKWMAVGCYQEVEIWDLAARKFSHRFGRETGYRFGIVEFFPDNKRIVHTGFPTYDAHVWDTALQKWHGWVHLYKYARSAKLSPDGKIFAASIDFGGSACGLHFIPTERRKTECRISTPLPVNSIAFSPDGRVVAARCSNGKMLLIHFKSLQVIGNLAVTAADLKSFPLGLAFSPDGDLLAADNGVEIFIWDLRDCRKKLPQYEQLSPERLEAVWQDLARWMSEDDDYLEVPPFHQLLGVPEQAVSFLGTKLEPAPRPDPLEMKRLVRELDHPEFKVRDKAFKDLRVLDGSAKPGLQQALANGTTVETKRRIELLLENMTSTRSAEYRRQYRAIWILSYIDTEPARRIVRELAAGAPGAYLTQLAQERLKWIKERKIEPEK